MCVPKLVLIKNRIELHTFGVTMIQTIKLKLIKIPAEKTKNLLGGLRNFMIKL